MAVEIVAARAGGHKTRDCILNAAEEVFIRFGYEGARMDQIATRADVRKANIYYYFESKEGLYYALVERTLGEVIAEVGDFLRDSPQTDWETLDRFLDLFFQLAERYRGLIGLAFGELLHPPREPRGQSPIGNLLRQVETLGKQMIAAGIERGVYRREHPAQMLLTLQGALFYYFLLPDDRLREHIGADKFSPEALAQRKAHLRTHIRRILEP